MRGSQKQNGREVDLYFHLNNESANSLKYKPTKAAWPELSFADARKNYETIHLWTQIVGKIKLVKMPWTNHSWHVTLYVTPTGLTTSDIMDDNKHFLIDFDFIQHQLQIKTSAGENRSFNLKELSVAGCYTKLLTALQELGIQADTHPIPNELEYHPRHINL